MCSRKCAIYTLLILGIPLLIAGIIVAAVGSFQSLAEDNIKKVGFVYVRISVAVCYFSYRLNL